VNWRKLRVLAALATLLGAGYADAAAMNMRVFEINDHLLSFYDGRPPALRPCASPQLVSMVVNCCSM
jgi:hypothetical protein